MGKKIAAVVLIVVLSAVLAVGVAVRLNGGMTESVQPEQNVAAEVTPTAESSTAEPEKTSEVKMEPLENTEEKNETPVVDESAFTDVNSLLLVANKVHRLPEGYEPDDLVNVNEYGAHGTISPYMRLEATEHLVEMTEAAAEAGIYLQFSSAYRSEAYQSTLYYGYVGQYGVETADTISSRPGYSDHQTGLACDFVEGGGYDFTEDFELTASGIWLRENAHKFGFIMRYPKGKDHITGYAYEPWHYRYIGVEYATAVWNVDEYYSFEEYFHVAGGQEYSE